MEHPDLLILRHGETVWNREGKFQGRKDSPLTELGQAQAVRQGVVLGAIPDLPSTAFSSPQGRAAHTARLALGPREDLILDDRLQEIDFGAWEGLTREQMQSWGGDLFDDELWHFTSPGGEDFQMISARLRDFLNDLVEPAVIVTHGITSVVLRGICMGLGEADVLTLSREQGCVFHLSNGAETILR